MIFSLGEISRDVSFPIDNSLDIFCFFKVSHSVNCPSSLWFEALCASLKLKHSVLILEENFQHFPEWNVSARWQTGADWSWLSSRALGVILKRYPSNPMNFQEFKTFLKSSK